MNIHTCAQLAGPDNLIRKSWLGNPLKSQPPSLLLRCNAPSQLPPPRPSPETHSHPRPAPSSWEVISFQKPKSPWWLILPISTTTETLLVWDRPLDFASITQGKMMCASVSYRYSRAAMFCIIPPQVWIKWGQLHPDVCPPGDRPRGGRGPAGPHLAPLDLQRQRGQAGDAEPRQAADEQRRRQGPGGRQAEDRRNQVIC